MKDKDYIEVYETILDYLVEYDQNSIDRDSINKDDIVIEDENDYCAFCKFLYNNEEFIVWEYLENIIDDIIEGLAIDVVDSIKYELKNIPYCYRDYIQIDENSILYDLNTDFDLEEHFDLRLSDAYEDRNRRFTIYKIN